MAETVATYGTSREAILAARALNEGRQDYVVYGTRRLTDGRCEVIKVVLSQPKGLR